MGALEGTLGTETVVAWDPAERRWYEIQVRVRKRFTIAIECSCWRHREPHCAEVIVTGGGVYYRRLGAEEHFRESGRVGPLALSTSEQSRLE